MGDPDEYLQTFAMLYALHWVAKQRDREIYPSNSEEKRAVGSQIALGGARRESEGLCLTS
jgi:hypothetical protein